LLECVGAAGPGLADRRLAGVYDPLDPDRSDLDAYAAMVDELGARTVLDVGCGTGTFAVLLAARGLDVTRVDPAGASVDVARGKPGAERVRWVVGEVDAVADLRFDLVTMTANVAQVFLTDEAWRSVLSTAYDVLRPGGHLVFETRDPAREAWLEWTKDESFASADVEGQGHVESWNETTDVDGELVTFRSTLVFEDATLTSQSTLRFRERTAVARDLAAAGFVVLDVRDAPDRPGRELVFVAQRQRDHLDASASLRRRADRPRLRAAAPPPRLRRAPGRRRRGPRRAAAGRDVQRGEGPRVGRRLPPVLGVRRLVLDLAGSSRPGAALQGRLGGRLKRVV
jgi:SAM-dependent methyltransferase